MPDRVTSHHIFGGVSSNHARQAIEQINEDPQMFLFNEMLDPARPYIHPRERTVPIQDGLFISLEQGEDESNEMFESRIDRVRQTHFGNP